MVTFLLRFGNGSNRWGSTVGSITRISLFIGLALFTLRLVGSCTSSHIRKGGTTSGSKQKRISLTSNGLKIVALSFTSGASLCNPAPLSQLCRGFRLRPALMGP